MNEVFKDKGHLAEILTCKRRNLEWTLNESDLNVKQGEKKKKGEILEYSVQLTWVWDMSKIKKCKQRIWSY